METLNSLLPDVDVLLALAPEELAPILLKLAKTRLERGMFISENVTETIAGSGMASAWVDVYPPNKMDEVDVALAEAWQWLRNNILIVPAREPNGKNGWMVITRRGNALVDDKAFSQFKYATAFPKALLHSSIAEEVWLDIARGKLDTAVFEAFKAVEVAVREAGGFAATDFGLSLMRKAFHKDAGPLSDMSQPEAEREALANLFVGAIGSYKNPHSHRTVTISDPRDAQEMALLASHLLRIVDARKPK